MSDQIFIQHRFKIEKDGLTLQDALVLPQSEYEALTPEEIEDLKNERFANFKEAVTNPPKEPEKTKEEIIAQLDNDLENLRQNTEALTTQKIELKKKAKLPLTSSETTFNEEVLGGK